MDKPKIIPNFLSSAADRDTLRRGTLMARRVTVSRVMFQNPELGATIFAGKRSKAPPW
jgi:hypothetical protein